jgi:GTP-binding protein
LRVTSKQNGGGSGDRSTVLMEMINYRVPLGTVVKKETEILFKLPKMVKTNSISRWKRGLGNWQKFDQSNPRYSQPGLPGVEMDVILELKFWLM